MKAIITVFILFGVLLPSALLAENAHVQMEAKICQIDADGHKTEFCSSLQTLANGEMFSNEVTRDVPVPSLDPVHPSKSVLGVILTGRAKSEDGGIKISGRLSLSDFMESQKMTEEAVDVGTLSVIATQSRDFHFALLAREAFTSFSKKISCCHGETFLLTIEVTKLNSAGLPEQPSSRQKSGK